MPNETMHPLNSTLVGVEKGEILTSII